MSDACGCGPDEPTTEGAEENEQEAERLVDVSELRAAAVAGVLLLAGYGSGWVGGPDMLGQVLLWAALLVGASTFVPSTLRRLAKRKIGVGTLMTIAAVGAVLLGEVGEAAMLAFLYSISEGLEEYSLARTRRGLRALLSLVPDEATVLRDGAQVTVSPRDLRVGDLMLVRPGERVATDGVIRAGHTALDVSAITGESVPVEAGPGRDVFAGSINGTGVLEVEVTTTAADNSLARIVRIVEAEQSRKGTSQRLADRIAKPLVPGVLVVAALIAVVGSLLGDPATWIERALVVLVAASPCALAISVPVTVVSGIGAASKFGVIIKSGAAFERLGGIRHVALDKTGTLTRNQPTVTEVLTTDGSSPAEVLGWAAALEIHSTHPLAAAIITAAPHTPVARQINEDAGHGITGVVDGGRISVGSPRWLSPGSLTGLVQDLEDHGMTVVIVHREDQPVGAIGVRDELRPETADLIQELTETGYGVTMLTGDNTRTAHALALEAGIDDVRAELHPEGKAHAVAELQEHGPVAMIGDGINDALALASAPIGIAMGAKGADAAVESADIAFTGHDLSVLPRALQHASRGRRIINQNIVLSLAIIVGLLPLAITAVLGLAAVVLVHELAEVIVIANGLRAGRLLNSTSSTNTGIPAKPISAVSHFGSQSPAS